MHKYMPLLAALPIYAAAVMSPGPNFLVVVRSALTYSRRVGLQTALGVLTGTTFWLFTGVFGVSVLLTRSPWLYEGVKVLGAIYLCYLALRILWARVKGKQSNQLSTEFMVGRVGGLQDAIGGWQAYRMGLLTQLSNPAAAVFFLAFFTTIIDPATPWFAKARLGVAMATISGTWYSLVVTFFSHHVCRAWYAHFAAWVDLLFALLLLGLAVRVLL